MTDESVLVNHWYATPVGHCVEALRYALGYYRADPSRRVSLVLNGGTPVELASWCGFIEATYGVDFPFSLIPDAAEPDFTAIPRDWDWIVDEARRMDRRQGEAFPGFGRYYEASDRWFRARLGRGLAGEEPPSYLPHQQVVLDLPDAAREWAARRAPHAICVMPAGSSPRERYPSVASWELVLTALRRNWPDVPIVLVGKLARDAGTSSSVTRPEVDRLLESVPGTVECFDVGLARQLAVVEASDLFISPHTGFGMAVLTVGTPWLCITGGLSAEYFFNSVPFRSIFPDPDRSAPARLFEPWPDPVDDDGPRLPEATIARIREDLDKILAAADELIDGRVPYEQALRDYFGDLVRYRGGDASGIGSIDGIHKGYV